MIKLKTYSIKNLPLTNQLLVTFISKFWEEIFSSVKDTKHLLILCKVQFSETEMGYRTLGSLKKVNYVDRELFIDFLAQNLSILNESYLVHPILNITFTYIIKEGICKDNNRALLTDLSETDSRLHSFNNMKLPISMEPGDYGEIIASNFIEIDELSYHRFIVKNGNKVYQIDRSLDKKCNKVTILGNIELSWIDTKLTDLGSDIFKREIKKSTFYFMGGEIVLRKQILPAKAFTKLTVDNKLNNNFITLDIETIKKDNKLVPYLICAYNGNDYITSYGQDQNALFKVFFDQLLTKVKSSVKIYAHNLSGFDGIFLIKHLLNYGKVEPLLFNGKLISIKIIVNIPGHIGKTILFKDSYLLLPLSLRLLCKAFDISTSKGYFPFKLTNIFYTGIIPRFENWIGITLSEYGLIKANYKGKIWSFQSEAIKYCKLDCKALHEIIIKFNELIFNEFKINVHTPLTLPALAMRIFKTHYMPENTIYQLLGKAEYNIRQSYTGGAVDVYIPHNRALLGDFFRKVKGYFIKLYYYDVNSLYPYVMAFFDMPIGKPVFFDGDIRKYDPNAYGFFYCKISAPDNLEHPLIQRRIKTSDGLRTIAGLGNWEGWICSVEMDNAVKYGYTFEILRGYEFNKGNIFKDYVLKMYNLRLEYEKGHPMNLIAKLLMNSLYGKFGMKLESTEIVTYDTSTSDGELSLRKDIKLYGEAINDYINIDKVFYLIIRKSSIPLKYDEELDLYHGQDINIAIASAITAGARVHMSYFKNNLDFNLYYTDTDSAVTDKPLPDSMIGNKLGQVKLEHSINRAVFLAPKVYGLEDEDGNTIIKVKGVTHEIANGLTLNHLEELLVKDSAKEFTQTKWFKKVIESEITVSDIVYTLKVTSNKRAPQYILQDGLEIYNSTRPYNYDEITSK
jgi:DNA polymerase family B